MIPTGPDSPQPRIGLREVAKAAGVSLMTASLSLRGGSSISAPTRERVRVVAAQLGYRPDPEIARLMGRLRSSRISQRSVTIALVDLRTEVVAGGEPYILRLCRGIERQLDALGYGTAVFRLRDYRLEPAKMMRVIRNRGIVGCILLPSNEPNYKFPRTLKWDGLAVVTATTSVLVPRFHSVVPNQIFNAMTLIERMERRGYEKIGAIFSEGLEQRTAHHYSLALAWHGHRERLLILPDGEAPAEDERRIADWLRRHRIELILAENIAAVIHALPAGRIGPGKNQVGLLSLRTIADRGIAYQDEQPEYIGESAVSLLAGMMHNNETGVPARPRVTTVEGIFCDGPSVRSATNVPLAE